MSNWFELDQDTWIEILDDNEPDEPDLDDFRLYDLAYQEQVRREEQESERQHVKQKRESERIQRIQQEVDRRVSEWMNTLIDFGIEFDSHEYKLAYARAIRKFMYELIPTVLCPGCREAPICSDCNRCYNCFYGISDPNEFSNGNIDERCESCSIKDKLYKKYNRAISAVNEQNDDF